MSDFVQLQLRRDTAAAWTAANPVLLAGEPGVEVDTGKGKVGNGVNEWGALPYAWGNAGGASVSWGDITGTVGLNAALTAAFNNKQSLTDKGEAGGYAPLDAEGKLLTAQIPATVEFVAKKGVANGYTPLGANSRVPDVNLPENLERTDKKGAVGGYAGLDAGGKIAISTLPAEVQLKAEKGQALGYTPLGEDGKVPGMFLPEGFGGGGSSGDAFPRGIIVMWGGKLINIPTGWVLCDGNNGTPDLTDRFIVGVSSPTQDPGEKGGAHQKALSEANMPSHAHNFRGGSHVHRMPNHRHSIDLSTGTSTQSHTHGLNIDQAGHIILSANGGTTVYSVLTHASGGNRYGHGVESAGDLKLLNSLGGSTTETSMWHNHSVSGQTDYNNTADTEGAVTGGTVEAAGQGQAFDVRPKYYALAFIMKL